jgi:hypothetical protein
MPIFLCLAIEKNKSNPTQVATIGSSRSATLRFVKKAIKTNARIGTGVLTRKPTK